MAPSRDRSILGVIALIIFLSLSQTIFTIPERHMLPFGAAFAAVCVTVLSFNIPILLCWISSGIFTGIAVFAASLFVALTGVLRSGYYGAAVFAWSFPLAAFAGYRYWSVTKHTERSARIRSEKFEEDINVLSDELQKKKAEAKALEEKLSRYSVLKEVAESLTMTLTMEEIAKLIVEKAAATVMRSPSRILLFLVDVQKQELMLSASRGPLRTKEKKGDIFDRWVLKHGIPLLVEDAAEDFRFPSRETLDPGAEFRSLISAPLLSGTKVIGILRIDSPKKALYTQDDLRLLDILGGLGSVAVQNAFLYSWIQDLAIHDALTGLFVRRYFMKRLGEELQRAARRQGPAALLMLDIDKFKWYNDKYGHATGDLVLRHITDIINSQLDTGDMAARYGGEEIAVLLAGADVRKAQKTAEVIRKKIEENPLIVRREKHNVTVSIGVAGYPADAAAEEDLVKMADDRLYKAKSLGRNRVCAG